jgi:hypothetical protein
VLATTKTIFVLTKLWAGIRKEMKAGTLATLPPQLVGMLMFRACIQGRYCDARVLKKA